jgi:hypothetical protein
MRINTGKKIFIALGFALALMILFPASIRAQTATQKAADKSWNAFWSKFTKVVRTKDKKGFIALTSKEFTSAGGETIEEWVEYGQWDEWLASVRQGTKNFRWDGRKIRRITQDNYLVFVYEKKGWRFAWAMAA